MSKININNIFMDNNNKMVILLFYKTVFLRFFEVQYLPNIYLYIMIERYENLISNILLLAVWVIKTWQQNLKGIQTKQFLNTRVSKKIMRFLPLLCIIFIYARTWRKLTHIFFLIHLMSWSHYLNLNLFL